MTAVQWDADGNAVLPRVAVDREALLRAAVQWFNLGASLLPVRTDGSKAPGGGRWTDRQDTRATFDEVIAWFDPRRTTTDGLGIVTGTISGSIEMLELEGRAMHAAGIDMDLLRALCDDNGILPVLHTVMGGYVEASAGLGVHAFLRTEGPARRNVKIAVKMDTDRLLPNGRPTPRTLIETRGDGGFVVLAPSAGRSRKLGGAWTVQHGTPETMAVISVEERDHLYAVLGLLNEQPARLDRPPAPVVGAAGTTPGLRPGEDFNERADWASDLLLGGAGWKRKYRVGSGWGWARPGKDTPGISATTGQAGTGKDDRLFVFSSSTEFPEQEPLTKFWVYAELHHADAPAGAERLKAAARALGKMGFGTDDRVAGTYGGFIEAHGDSGAGVAPAPRSTPPSTGGGMPPGWDTIAASPDTAQVAPAPAGDGVRTQVAPGPAPDTSGTDGGTHVAAPDVVPDVFPPSIDQQDPAPPAVLAGTQVAHSQLLINEHGRTIRYVAEMETWLTWESYLWRPQGRDGGHVYEAGKQVAMMMAEDTAERQKWKRNALTSGGISAALRLAQTSPAVRVTVSQLDAHPYELNTPGGVLDLRTGTLLAPDPRHLHTKSTLCAPDAGADRALWLGFLATTFQGDTEMIDWIQRLFGYIAIGEVREHILPVFYGSGQNGKGVLLETVGGILGDYSVTMPPNYLVEGQASTSDTAMLLGARLAMMSEIDEGARFAEALMKRITGGDTLTGRLLYKDWMSWKPSHTGVLLTNNRLIVPSGGHSFWRRLREVPFGHTMPPEQRDGGLQDRLITEHGPAILSWVTEGAVAYLEHGLRDPASVVRATSDYERSSDSLGRFVDEECVVGSPHYKIRVSELRDRYVDYCRLAGDPAVSAKAMSAGLKGRWNVDGGRSANARWYVGIRFKEDYEKASEVDVIEPAGVAQPAEEDPQLGFWYENR